jgi:hypothetical protein
MGILMGFVGMIRRRILGSWKVVKCVWHVLFLSKMNIRHFDAMQGVTWITICVSSSNMTCKY